MKPSLGEDIRSVLAISFGAAVSTVLTVAFLEARPHAVEHHAVNVAVPVPVAQTYFHFIPLDHKKKLEVVLMSGPEPLPEGALRATLHGRAVTRVELEQAAAALSEARVVVQKMKRAQAEAAREQEELWILQGAPRPATTPGGGQR